MALYVVTGVHLDAHGRVVFARMQRADGATNALQGQPQEREAHDIANMIATGDEIHSVFIVPGSTVLGPKFRSVVFANGSEGIELEQDFPGRRVQDLFLF